MSQMRQTCLDSVSSLGSQTEDHTRQLVTYSNQLRLSNVLRTQGHSFEDCTRLLGKQIQHPEPRLRVPVTLHIPSRSPPTTAMHSILTLSSQSFRLPEKDAPGFRTPLRPCPRQVGSAWELGSPPFTIYLPFGKVDSGAFLNLISQFSHRVEF